MKKILPILTLIALALPAVTLAQTTPTLPELSLLPTLEKIAKLIFWILLAVSIIFLVYAGIIFVTSAGSEEQIKKAKTIIFYAIIGIVVALLAYGIRGFLLSQLQ
jgi:amino acid transporter